jgi:hypothetical protein
MRSIDPTTDEGGRGSPGPHPLPPQAPTTRRPHDRFTAQPTQLDARLLDLDTPLRIGLQQPVQHRRQRPPGGEHAALGEVYP